MVVPAYPGRVVILHNVIVETENVLGCLECCYNDYQMQKKYGMMNKQTQTFNF